MYNIGLFRPRNRRDWMEGLRSKGHSVKVVHDPERIPDEIQFMIVDSAAGKWKEHLNLLKDVSFPIYVLVQHRSPEVEEDLEVAGWLVDSESLEEQLHNDGSNEKLISASLAMKSETKDRLSTLSQRKSNPTWSHNPKNQEGTSMPEVSSEYVEESATTKAEEKVNAPVSVEPSPDSANEPTESHVLPPMGEHFKYPSVAAVYAPKGGVGKTTFLLHLASSLAQQNLRVCILDFDFMYGTVASMLGVRPRYTIEHVVQRMKNHEDWRSCLFPAKAGFFVAAAPLRPGTFSITPQILVELMNLLKGEMDVLLLDTSSHFDTTTKFILEQAESLWVMTTGEPASIDNLERIQPQLSQLQRSGEVSLVVNRQLNFPSDLKWTKRFPWPVLLELPEESGLDSTKGIVNEKLTSTSSSYSGQVQHLVNVWTGEQEEADPNKRTLAYWMGLFMKKGGRGRQTLKIRDCRVDYPAKSRGGLYVHLEGNRNQILKGAADRLAVETANRKGWKGSGQATIGHPMQETEDRFAKAYWFHENLK